MNIKLISLALLAATSATAALANPYSVYPFQVPEQYEELLKDYRTDWHRLTGFEHSGLHWQQFISIFINKDQQVYENNYKEYLRYYQDADEYEDEDEIPEPKFMKYSEGTIVLKENYSSNAGVPDIALSVTMMIKREAGYDTQHGDWQYVQFSKGGTMIMSGKADDPVIKASCSSCHINIADRDYIFANFFSKRNSD